MNPKMAMTHSEAQYQLGYDDGFAAGQRERKRDLLGDLLWKGFENIVLAYNTAKNMSLHDTAGGIAYAIAPLAACIVDREKCAR